MEIRADKKDRIACQGSASIKTRLFSRLKLD
jgi:hypothetical protein